MFRKLLIAAGLTAIIVVAGTTYSDSINTNRELPPAQKERIQTHQDISNTVKAISHQIDLWHDAVLKGDEATAKDREAVLVKMMKDDLEATRAATRHEARKSSLAGSRSLIPPDSEARVDPEEAAASFRAALSILNTKEQLALSFSRTDAFSNKYRLISDYIEVLRRQLGMSRLQLAEEVNTVPGSTPNQKQKK